MVRRILLGFTWLLSFALPSALLAAPQASLDRLESALGEPLTLSITGPAEALNELDTSLLDQDFLLQGRTLSSANGQATLGLTLYPRHTGPLTLPALATSAGATRPLSLKVLDGSADVSKVVLRVETDPPQPLARQATRLTLEACDDGSLSWERPIIPPHEGMAIRPLGEQQFDADREGVRCTAHLWHWAMTPTAGGPVKLALPWIKATHFGQQLRFPPPDTTLDMLPIPGWLPMGVAVGQPEITLFPLPERWPLDRPLAWRMEILGSYDVSSLKELLRLQLAPYPEFNTYAPTVEALTPDDRNSPLTRLSVTLYLTPRQTGPLSVPTLRLPWFDVVSGKLEHTEIPFGHVSVFNPLLLSLLHWTQALLGVALLSGLSWAAWRALSWRRARRRSLQAIASAGNMQAVAQAVRNFTLHPSKNDASPTATLGTWREAMAKEVSCPGLDDLVIRLEATCYGKAAATDTALRQHTLDILSRTRPKPSARRR